MNIILIVDEFTIASIIPLIFEVLSFVVVFLYRKNLIILIDGYDRFVLFEHPNDNSCSYVYVEGINFFDKEEAIKKFNLDL